MGTGLRVILSDSKSVNHLIASAELGFSFPNGQLASILISNQTSLSIDEIDQRLRRAKHIMEEYSYKKISEKILSLSDVKQGIENL